MTEHSDNAVTTLVVGHARDPSSDRALAVAADLGRRLHAGLHVVHVVDVGDYPIDIDAADWEERGQHDDSGVGWTYEVRRVIP